MLPAARITTIPVIIASFSWRRWCRHHRGGAVPISSTDGLSHRTPVGQATDPPTGIVKLLTLCGAARIGRCAASSGSLSAVSGCGSAFQLRIALLAHECRFA